MEEFQEADVLWPDNHRHGEGDYGHGHHHRQQQHNSGVAARPGGSSAPVSIPAVMRSSSMEWGRDVGAAAAFVPPHELAARGRRCSAEERAAFSVCVGHGRTLKGRDLRSVRTAVLRLTGFLES